VTADKIANSFMGRHFPQCLHVALVHKLILTQINMTTTVQAL